VQVETLTRADLERFDGKTVVTTVTVDKPACTWGAGKNLRTVFGPKSVSHEDLSIVLKGNRLRDTDRGAKVTVVGALRVIWHQESTINGRTFAGFTEVRIEERDMTPALALALALGIPSQPGDTAAPVKFDTLTLKEAEQLNVAAVTIRFTVATSAVTHGAGAHLRTVVGPEDRGNGAEWTVFLIREPAERCRRRCKAHGDGVVAGD